mmetsp:Transcript_9248/g.18002  ORF Transcript_9248/g.18002 Transcript_9248/m.18002 type:complete len:284 (-) Transcript_9248:65-916(-)
MPHPPPRLTPRSECEDAGLVEADLVEVGAAGVVEHGRRPAHEHQTVRARRRDGVNEHGVVDEASETLPPRRRPVEGVVALEAARVCGPPLVDLRLEQNVLLRLVCEEEVDCGGVGGVTQDRVDDLEHGGDAGAARNHADVLRHRNRLPIHLELSVAFVLDVAKRPRNVDGLTQLQTADHLRHHATVDESLARRIVSVPGAVNLDDEIKEAKIEIGGSGRVLPLICVLLVFGDGLSVPFSRNFAIWCLSENLDVLADREAKHCLLVREAEAKAKGVGRELIFLD